MEPGTIQVSVRDEDEQQTIGVDAETLLYQLAQEIEAFWDEHETSTLTDPDGKQTILRDEPPAFVLWALEHLGEGTREQ